jgi:AcrR family transcriptional regulator
MLKGSVGIAERRVREREELRQKILDAARELFVSQGYEAVTMRAIAEKIEYSPTAIYLHFPDKATLLADLCRQDFQTLARSFSRVMKIADPIERLVKIGHAYVDFAIEHPGQYQFMFGMPYPDDVPPSPDALETKGRPEDDSYALLRLTLDEAMQKKLLRADLKDVDMVAQLIWGAVHGIITLHFSRQKDDWIPWRPLRKTAHVLIDTLVTGLLR